MAVIARPKAVPSRRKMALRGGAGNAPSKHRMSLRSKVKLPDSSVICPICLEQIGMYDDYLKCQNQCRKIHRHCFVNWCGKPCLCKGLLCDRFPDPNLGRAPAYLNTCANCKGPSYQQNLAIIIRKWMTVFSSLKFKTYVRRKHPDLWAGPHGWKAFHKDHLIVTNNDEHGRNPRIMYNVLRNNGDTAQEAFTFVWEMYLISRLTFPNTGVEPQLSHTLLQLEYRKFVNDLMRKYAVPDPPFTLRYRFDRVLYCHDDPINDGRDDPPYAMNRVRACKLSKLTDLIHTHNSNGRAGGVWDEFRKMYERPEAEWGLNV